MFKEFDIKNLNENIFKMIDDEWMLITAGNKEKHNMMTASWGFMGIMWHKPCVMATVRPQRYTMQFIEKEDYYTVSFYGEDKKLHAICGKLSGRDIDKTKECGLTPVVDKKTGAVYFEEARMVLICKKHQSQALAEEGFTSNEIIDSVYPTKDYHNMIIGEIVSALVKE